MSELIPKVTTEEIRDAAQAELRAPGPCGKHPLACYTPVVYEKHKPSGASTGDEWRTSCTVCAELAKLRAPMKCGHPKACLEEGVVCFRDGVQESYQLCSTCAELEEERVMAVAERAAHAEQIEKLRRLLWLNHARYIPGVHTPYGDDGEMQCCGIDFKRWTVDEIDEFIAARAILPPDDKIKENDEDNSTEF